MKIEKSMKSALTSIMQSKVVFMKVEYIDQEIILDVDDFDYDLFDFDKKEDGQVLGHYHGEYVAIDLDDIIKVMSTRLGFKEDFFGPNYNLGV